MSPCLFLLFSISDATQLYATEDVSKGKKQQKLPFKLKSRSFHDILDSQAGRYSKKAPVERRERRKRDIPQGLKLQISF